MNFLFIYNMNFSVGFRLEEYGLITRMRVFEPSIKFFTSWFLWIEELSHTKIKFVHPNLSLFTLKSIAFLIKVINESELCILVVPRSPYTCLYENPIITDIDSQSLIIVSIPPLPIVLHPYVVLALKNYWELIGIHLIYSKMLQVEFK